jgi:hypothetical protein
MQMGIAIGGEAGYKGFEGFDLQSYERGLLDISIAPRPVFPEIRGEKATATNAFWQTWASVASSGAIPFEAFARSHGWTDEMLTEFGTQRMAQILIDQEDVISDESL